MFINDLNFEGNYEGRRSSGHISYLIFVQNLVEGVAFQTGEVARIGDYVAVLTPAWLPFLAKIRYFTIEHQKVYANVIPQKESEMNHFASVKIPIDYTFPLGTFDYSMLVWQIDYSSADNLS